MTDTYEVTFIGGPADGTTWHVQQLHDVLRYPHTQPITAHSYNSGATEPEPGYTIATYQLAIAYGAPSRDDAGRYRYQYRGTR